MSANDGTILGITKILDNGPDATRLNIVLVAEGFTVAEQDAFNGYCDDFLAALQADLWYPFLGVAINVHRLNVTSTDSGADIPSVCPDESEPPEGTGTYAATYFDASYCNPDVWRALSGDTILVSDSLDACLPAWTRAIVIVNSTVHGGTASGNVSYTSVDPGWEQGALHEMGHTFRLADEYEYMEGCDTNETGQDVAPSGDVWEPSEPNVTMVTNPAKLKWRNLLTPGVPVPTMKNPDCTHCDPNPNVLLDDTAIGLYEGGQYYHCGIYRPSYACRMRLLGPGFCRVCVEAIAAHLATWVTPTPVMEVSPPDLEFGEVGVGLTLYLAFEIKNIRSGVPGTVTIELSTPTGVFAYAPGTETAFALPAPVCEPYTSRRIYVAFTAPSTGGPDFAGNLTIMRTDVTPPELVMVMNLYGTSVKPPPVDSVLVVDRSGSMGEETGVFGMTKQDMAIEAANLYVSLLKDTDKIGLVRYNEHSDSASGDILVKMKTAGSPDTGAGRTAMRNALNAQNLFPEGTTSIGAGIINGSGVLDGGTADARAIVVLTDGRQNTDPDIPEGAALVVTKNPAQRVFAVGLGLNQLEDKLDQIASVTNGFAAITGDLVDDREFLLQKLYVQILSDVGDEAFVADPRFILRPGQVRKTPIFLSGLDVSADFILTYRKASIFPKYMDVWLEAPDGSTLTIPKMMSLSCAIVVSKPGHMCFRWRFPVAPDKPNFHKGAWKICVRNIRNAKTETGQDANDTLYYAVMCKARSNFRLGGAVIQKDHAPGSPMEIVLEPTLFGQSVALTEPVTAAVTGPNGKRYEQRLRRDDFGYYRGSFGSTGLCGPYQICANVEATASDGCRITRYRHMTGLIFRHVANGHETDPCRRARAAVKTLQELIDHCCRKPAGEDVRRHSKTRRRKEERA
jgi:hypothetical protein